MRALRALNANREQLGTISFLSAAVGLVLAASVWWVEAIALNAAAEGLWRVVPVAAVGLVLAISIYAGVRVVQIKDIEEYDPIYLVCVGFVLTLLALLVFAVTVGDLLR